MEALLSTGPTPSSLNSFSDISDNRSKRVCRLPPLIFQEIHNGPFLDKFYLKTTIYSSCILEKINILIKVQEKEKKITIYIKKKITSHVSTVNCHLSPVTCHLSQQSHPQTFRLLTPPLCTGRLVCKDPRTPPPKKNLKRRFSENGLVIFFLPLVVLTISLLQEHTAKIGRRKDWDTLI